MPAGWGRDTDDGRCHHHANDNRPRESGKTGNTGETGEPWNDIQRRTILEALRDGATLTDAARSAGVAPRTFRYWRNHHEEIRRAVQRAEAEAKIEAAGLVREAAEDGDWRAAAHQLERLVDPDEQTLEVILRLVRTVLAGELDDMERVRGLVATCARLFADELGVGTLDANSEWPPEVRAVEDAFRRYQWLQIVVLEVAGTDAAFKTLDMLDRNSLDLELDVDPDVDPELIPDTQLDFLRNRERDTIGEAHYRGVREGLKWAGVNPDSVDWANAPEAGDAERCAMDTLVRILEIIRCAKARRLLARWNVAADVCRERWGTDLEELIAQFGDSKPILETIDRARSILNDDADPDRKADLEAWRELLETAPDAAE